MLYLCYRLLTLLAQIAVADYRDKDKWLADRAPLFNESEVQELCDNPQNVLLEPAQVDTILQYIVLSHDRPVLLVAALHSTEFITNLLRLGDSAAGSKRERIHLVAAAVPDLHDDRAFGNAASFEFVVLPVYLPGHYVRLSTFSSKLSVFFEGDRYLRRARRPSSLLRQHANA